MLLQVEHPMITSSMEEETLDIILDGRLRLLQNKRGYRFTVDSILLSHFVSLRQRTRAIDLGCGNGIILIILAKRFPHVKCAGLEIQEKLATLAMKNVQFNDLSGRVEILSGDARNIKNIFPAHSFDAVIFNPPYRKLNSGKINPLQEKAIARHEINGSLKDFLTAAKHLLKPAGRVFTIYPAKRMVELVYLFRNNDVEPKRMKLVFSHNLSEATFVLAEGRSGSREELKIEKPLFIYDQERNYSPEMSGIFSELSRFPTDDGG
jgi:tRNA1Val (adenine37-N6)-methyltransferase